MGSPFRGVKKRTRNRGRLDRRECCGSGEIAPTSCRAPVLERPTARPGNSTRTTWTFAAQMRHALDLMTLHPTGRSPTAGRSSTPLRRVPSARPWVDVHLRPEPCAVGSLPGQNGPDLVEADGRGDERSRVDVAAGVGADGGIET